MWTNVHLRFWTTWLRAWPWWLHFSCHWPDAYFKSRFQPERFSEICHQRSNDITNERGRWTVRSCISWLATQATSTWRVIPSHDLPFRSFKVQWTQAPLSNLPAPLPWRMTSTHSPGSVLYRARSLSTPASRRSERPSKGLDQTGLCHLAA